MTYPHSIADCSTPSWGSVNPSSCCQKGGVSVTLKYSRTRLNNVYYKLKVQYYMLGCMCNDTAAKEWLSSIRSAQCCKEERQQAYKGTTAIGSLKF